MQIYEAGNRAAKLTQQLLAFSRRQMLLPKVICLNPIIQEIQPMLRRLIRENIDIQLDLDEQLGTILADPTQIEQIIMNLALNASDAMPRGGRMTVQTRHVPPHDLLLEKCQAKPGYYTALVIRDGGEGMSKEVQERIFEPFFTTKEQGKGTGLGLSTVYGIVKQSGGTIHVESELDRGSTFTILFPLHEGEPTMEEVHPDSSESLQGRETILLVEDESFVRSITTNFLSEYGYKVLICQNGEEAIEIARQYTEPIHLLLTDVVLPRMNGPEIAEQLRALRPEIKVVYMSGYAKGIMDDHGIDEENVYFLQKPFPSVRLLRMIRHALDS